MVVLRARSFVRGLDQDGTFVFTLVCLLVLPWKSLRLVSGVCEGESAQLCC